MNIEFDDGYSFGLGLFETVLLYDNRAIFLEEHIARINNSLVTLGINTNKLTKDEIEKFLDNSKSLFSETKKKEVLKIVISEKNRVFLRKDYSYKEEDFEKGFKIDISSVLRNETSVLTYHKTLNYGDNILEKRKSKKNNYDEPIFLNSKGEITEGATTNIFFIKDKKIYTPRLSCGLLNGTLRKYILLNYEVTEKKIYLNEVDTYDEIFVTNSLLGVMPVIQFGEKRLESTKLSKEIRLNYEKKINIL